jgi:hypothetical protein
LTEGESIFTPEEWQRLKRLRRIVIMGAGILSFLVCLALVIGFFIAAPKPEENAQHRIGIPDAVCRSCHEFGTGGPLMPHRPFPHCTFCHRPQPPKASPSR